MGMPMDLNSHLAGQSLGASAQVKQARTPMCTALTTAILGTEERVSPPFGGLRLRWRAMQRA